jgi:hypothetical protein
LLASFNGAKWDFMMDCRPSQLRGVHMTKKEAKARKAAWQRALVEGRIVRSNGGMTLTSNKTVHDAKMLVFALRDNGDRSAEIVKVIKPETAID